jgi:ABC-type phosphate transport system substrate-binding protein
MRGERTMKQIVFLLFAVTLICFSLQAQVAVVAHKSVAASSVSRSELTDIYTLSTTMWENSAPIVVCDMRSDNPTKGKFYSSIKKSPNDLKKIWMRIVLSGEGKAPEMLDSEDEVLDRVASTPGAIGYVNASKVRGDVKVLMRID